jgi:PEP-CTERM/exosortase A-associated glycosyltransferase
VFRTDYILRYQNKLGLETVCITSPKQGGRKGEVVIIDNVKIYNTRMINNNFINKPFINEIRIMKTLKKKIKEVILKETPDIIHAHSPSLNGIPALKIGKKMGIPVVYEVRALWEDAAVDHGTFKEGSFKYRLSRYIEGRLLKDVDAVITICNGLKDEIKSRGINEDKITVIPNGVDEMEFSNVEYDEKLAERLKVRGKKVIGFIGSFYHYEGIDILIEAFEKISNDKKNLVLLLVGDGPEYHKILHIIELKNLNNKVITTGKVPHSEIMRYYSLMDLLVYPRKSIRLTEMVTPLKPLEAMAIGKIVIGSDVGGMKELITHNENGFLCESKDPKKLSMLLMNILERNDNGKIVEEAKRTVREFRNWNTIVKNYIHVYKNILKRAF